jgi:predicted nucleotidyltransferase
MKRDEAIDMIRKNQEALQAVGVAHAYLFGSVARDEAGPDSDIDVMIDVAYEPFSIFKIMRVEETLEDIFNRKVDVVVRADAMQGKKLCNIVSQAMNVF